MDEETRLTQMSRDMEQRLIKAALQRIGDNCLELSQAGVTLTEGSAYELMVATLELMALVAAYFIDK